MSTCTVVTKFRGNPLSWGVRVNYAGTENFAIFDRNRRLSRKRYELGPQLLWEITVSVPMTLSDLERRDAKGPIFPAD